MVNGIHWNTIVFIDLQKQNYISHEMYIQTATLLSRELQRTLNKWQETLNVVQEQCTALL